MRESNPFIIFDFGNILISLDYEKCFAAFEQCTAKKWNLDTIPDDISLVLRQLEVGHINTSTFCAAFRKYNLDLTDQQIIDAWNNLLGTIPKNRFPFLKALRKNYRIAILSNINEIHEKHINQYLEKEHGITSFDDYFDKIYYSHHIGMRKPNAEIYEFVTNDLRVSAHEIFFIDDLEENITAAKSFGWSGSVHDPKNKIEEKFEHYLKEIS